MCPPVGTDAVGKRRVATSGKAWWVPPRYHVSDVADDRWLVENIEPVFGASARGSGWRRGSGIPDLAVAAFFDIVVYEKGYAGGGLCRRLRVPGIF